MPRFLSIAYHDENNRPTAPPSPELQQKMGELFEEITKAGVVLDMAELTPTSQATRGSLVDGKVQYTDGPFTEAKEVVGGYTVIQAKDKAEALEWMKRFLEVQGQYDGTTVEVREILEG
ncbi:YciI family protein [Stackebrandtia nassauensis]|uniref:YCII-related protein n=1 Tax=Stackebrandtia nassauensis (strain DSM 44728 / CIP 108903 / NRRL B-16338 / NBRC 102104 / LLR-40K-21) TaxID=446470 RepID=D3PY44_STANL|nr:YciI family protein [Stackebrandtia nassauensis]ADD45373.1 YCII-related protein [Stackebrandtia nassauensis DSM 44728]